MIERRKEYVLTMQSWNLKAYLTITNLIFLLFEEDRITDEQADTYRACLEDLWDRHLTEEEKEYVLSKNTQVLWSVHNDQLTLNIHPKKVIEVDGRLVVAVEHADDIYNNTFDQLSINQEYFPIVNTEHSHEYFEFGVDMPAGHMKRWTMKQSEWFLEAHKDKL